MKTFTTTGYLITELSPAQQQKAFEKYHADLDLDFEYETTFEDVKSLGKCLGITIIDIYFSGFNSQGDGACFDGSFTYNPQWQQQLTEYAPNEKSLIEMGERLEAEYKLLPTDFTGSVKHYGYYQHKYCTDFDNESSDKLIAFIRDYMDYIYNQLEKEYNYQTSFESFVALAESNEFHFTDNGQLL